MTPARLRLRILSLLGLPALPLGCTPPPSAQPPQGTVVEIPRAVGSAVAVDREVEAPREPKGPVRSCGRDRYRAWTCGPTSTTEIGPGGCPTTAAGSYAMMNFPAQLVVDRSAPYDESLTRLYRERMGYGADQCCFSQCIQAQVRNVADPPPDGWGTHAQCIPEMTSTSLPAGENARCPKTLVMPGGPSGSFAAPFDAQSSADQSASSYYPTLGARLCCYTAIDYPMGMPVPGRALHIGGELRVSRAARGVAWSDEEAVAAVSLAELSPAEREAECARWLRDGALEHASVAAFARLSLELLGLAAPPELVEGAHRAALDEVRHAKVAYALASHYGGEPYAPGPLALEGVLPCDASLDDVAVSSFRDGCIGELWAAASLAREAERGEDRALAAIEDEMAADELEHADLAWRVVAWAIAREPRLGDRMIREAEQVLAVSIDELQREIISEVVLPCVSALTGVRSDDPI